VDIWPLARLGWVHPLAMGRPAHLGQVVAGTKKDDGRMGRR
jgi:hypothetical protein